MQTSRDIQHAHSSHLNAHADRTPAANHRVDIFEALMEALTSGERYHLVERDGELHLIEQTK